MTEQFSDREESDTEQVLSEEDLKGLKALPYDIRLQIAENLNDEHLSGLDQESLNRIEASRLGLKGSQNLPPIDRKDSETQDQLAWGSIFADKENLKKALQKSQLTEDQVIDAATKYKNPEVLEMMKRRKEAQLRQILKNKNSLLECLKKACKTPEEIEAFAANKNEYTKASEFMKSQGRSIYKNAKDEIFKKEMRERDAKDEIFKKEMRERDAKDQMLKKEMRERDAKDQKLFDQLKKINEEIQELLKKIDEETATERDYYDVTDKIKERDLMIDELTKQIINYYSSDDPHGIDDIWNLVQKHSQETLKSVIGELRKKSIRENNKQYEDIIYKIREYYIRTRRNRKE